MVEVKGCKVPKTNKEVPGWSTEEIKERPNVAVEEDTEEMKRWRMSEPKRDGSMLDEFG